MTLKTWYDRLARTITRKPFAPSLKSANRLLLAISPGWRSTLGNLAGVSTRLACRTVPFLRPQRGQSLPRQGRSDRSRQPEPVFLHWLLGLHCRGALRGRPVSLKLGCPSQNPLIVTPRKITFNGLIEDGLVYVSVMVTTPLLQVYIPKLSC